MNSSDTSQEKDKKRKQYPVYKDSGVERLGRIPAHWNSASLKRVCRLAYGNSLESKERAEEEVEVFGSNGALGRHNRANTLCPCLVIGRKGSFGKVHYSVKPVFAIDTTFFIDKRFTDTNLRWLYYALTWLQLDSVSEDSAIPGLNRQYAYACRVPLCPPKEQYAIAAFLDSETAKIDALISKKERLIELLQEKRTALITQAVTKGLDPNVPMKYSGVEWLGKIPSHWEGAKMWQISKAISGGTPAKDEWGYWDGDIPWISPKDMKRRLISSSEDTITERAISETAIKLIAPPIVLIVVRGMILAHSFPVAITTVPVTINQDMKALIFRDDIDPAYMAWVFEGIAKRLLAAIVEEAAHGTRAIRMDQWRSVSVTVPPYSEQRAIANYLDYEMSRMDTLMTGIREAIKYLKEYRVALISAAVTGKICVVSLGAAR
jgi:type I restriction enzyme S subunit